MNPKGPKQSGQTGIPKVSHSRASRLNDTGQSALACLMLQECQEVGLCKSTKGVQLQRAVSTGMLESTLCPIGAQADSLVHRFASDVVASAARLCSEWARLGCSIRACLRHGQELCISNFSRCGDRRLRSHSVQQLLHLPGPYG